MFSIKVKMNPRISELLKEEGNEGLEAFNYLQEREFENSISRFKILSIYTKFLIVLIVLIVLITSFSSCNEMITQSCIDKRSKEKEFKLVTYESKDGCTIRENIDYTGGNHRA